ncbi:MAG: phosphoribosyl-AMP cyclohydrolase [Planctomycetes bacterium]|nr:phosphoribosyl-AMP cyclohydrolase [Planctomycetota bacterium]
MTSLEEQIKGLKYDADGLIPAIVQDAQTKRVLMMAYMNAEALLATVRTGKTNFWSRSRGKFWVKGESSGHTQDVHSIRIDCDKDTLLVEVTQHGGACHAGYYSCFYRKLTEIGQWETTDEPVFDPEKIYKR